MSSFGYIDYDAEDSAMEIENELEIDETLSPIEKIKKYTYSDIILHRLHLARELGELSKQIEYGEFVNIVIPSITQLSNDNETVIRQALVEQLPEFANCCIKNGGEERIIKVLLPVLEKLIIDENTQVRSSAAESMIVLTKILSNELKKDYILPLIKKLATNMREEEQRIEAAEIIGKIVNTMQLETVRDFAVELISALSKDQMFRVRKATALTIGSIAKLTGPEIATESLLPIFIQLTKDDIWGVKKACTESIVLLAHAVTLPARINSLATIYESLIQDSSRWVRNSAFQNLGQFITTLASEPDHSIPPKLFEYYCGMIEGLKNKYGDSDTVLYCAYSFPGVLDTIGAKNWNQLKPVYSALSKDLQWKVRRTLSHSLHEVAKILGPELTEENLLPTFELFLNDLDQVKVGVIRNISSFLAILSPESRDTYVSTLIEIQKESVNWRFRQLLALQIGGIVELYSEETIRESIIPIAIQLCSDQVTAVRQSISSEMGKLVNHLTARSSTLLSEFLEQLTNFATKENCYDRQTFAQCCESLAEKIDAQLFVDQFFSHINNLSNDHVPNIRLVVSRLLSQKMNNEKFASISKEVSTLLEKLSKDTDPEVRFFCQPLK